MSDRKAKNNQRCRASFFESVTKGLDIDADMICRGFCAELKGKNRAEIGGVRRILTYSDRLVSFVTADGIFSVCGARLDCISFKRGAVIVEGEISAMGFDFGGVNENI